MSKKKYNVPSVNAIQLDTDFMLNLTVDSSGGGSKIESGGVDKEGMEADSRKKETGDSWSWE